MRIAVSGYRFPLRVMGLVTALVLLAGACAPPATPVPPTPAPTPTNTPLPPTATVVPPTPAPTPTNTPLLPTATVALPEGGAEWDYVALGDSIAWGWPKLYAAHIEADLGVEVTVHNWYRDAQSSAGLLSALRDNQELRSDIREAEVVTFLVSPQRFQRPMAVYEAGTCGGTDNQDCLREALSLLKADVDAILAEILSLTSTSDTIIRAMTYHNPMVNEWKRKGVFEDLNSYWKAHNEYLVQAASEHNIPVVRVDLAFNGPNGDEDPLDKDYVSDGWHPNAVGDAIIADLHRELGYEPLGP